MVSIAILGLVSRFVYGPTGVIMAQTCEIKKSRYLDMTFVRCVEEYGLAEKLSAVIGQCYLLSDNELLSYGFYYTCGSQTYSRVYLF